MLDFVNDTEDVLAAFKTYYETAKLADVTDPHLVYNLRAKLDAAGHYDDFEWIESSPSKRAKCQTKRTGGRGRANR